MKYIKLFLRLALGTAFLSAVADRFGFWPTEISVWGNWNSFVAYTGILNPWCPESALNILAWTATIAEIALGLALILGLKTELSAKLSGVLLLIFALSMTFATHVKGAFDFSVFTVSAAAFTLSTMKSKFLELDSVIRFK